MILLIQPSSAASERVFSLLNNTFNEQQQSCLEDYVEVSIMLQSFLGNNGEFLGNNVKE